MEHTKRLQEVDRLRSQTSLTSTIDLGFYPPFLRQNFPGIKYALAHGSSVFPIEKMGETVAHIPNSTERLLDLIVVVPDRKLPEWEPTEIGTDRSWDVFNPVTRTTAQFHGMHRARFPSHYPSKLSDMDLMELAKLQRTPRCPVMYFPLLQLPRAGNQSRDLWCKYGVVSESDLIEDLINWNPFHLAGRTQKAFISFDPARDIASKEDLCCVPPSSLTKAVAVNRVRAVQASLLLLPEKFTFGTLLYTIVSLSYMGDIRFPFVERKDKVTEILHSQMLALSDIYLNLLLATPGLINPRAPKRLRDKNGKRLEGKSKDKPNTEAATEQKAEDADSQTLNAPDDTKTPSDDSSPRNILTFDKIPNGLGHLSEDLLLVLAKHHQQLAGNARERLVETGSGANPDRIDPISPEMKELKQELLSRNFIISQDKSEETQQQMFNTLPGSIQEAAEAASGRMRVNRLFSPLSLLSNKRLNTTMGKPLPCDQLAMLNALHSLGRSSSIGCAGKALKVSGFMKCAQYTMKKVAKRLF